MKLEDLKLDQETMKNVEKLIQSEGDRVRTEYSAKIKELEGKLPKTQTEEEKALEARLKALEDKEKELNNRERLSKVASELSNKGLNGGLAKYLNIGEDTDLETYINEITEVIGKQANTYKAKGHKGTGTEITKEQFQKMNYKERAKLYNENKELYDALSK
ncbi:DUF4355 domain-containing protein [Clostridium cadaveris]|uniref:capsid assembly scaffolding protein Gp46 family protein n=1 Tax=Clostridium cadaveris TaxID=1529 RepID=UPI003991F2F8